MSTLKTSDRCTDTILDFIAGGVLGNPSGETAGNYNAYFGHVHAADDLGVRTLNGIYEFQAAMLARDPRSTAIGRYQFLKRTLEGLQKELGLSGSERFTPELQDRLAVRLLVRRGYSEWWRGEIDDREFAHRLSLEWASLPDPQKGGRSHYDGDAVGNHASTTLDAVLDMLRRAREARGDQPITPEVTVSDERIDIPNLEQIIKSVLEAEKKPNAIFIAFRYALDRFKEPSSYGAITGFLAVVGLNLSDPQIAMLAHACAIGSALLGFMLKDRKA